jgi:LAO/AO transport system kinase
VTQRGGAHHVPDLVARARRGDVRAVARLVSLLEAGPTPRREVLAAVMPFAGQAHVVGLTGAPGVGRSTLVAALISAQRRRDVRVGVLAVDPSSPRSGEALPGDRIRMTSTREPDPAVYIRSTVTRGHSAGLAPAVASAVRVPDAAGYGMILVETAGAWRPSVVCTVAARDQGVDELLRAVTRYRRWATEPWPSGADSSRSGRSTTSSP